MQNNLKNVRNPGYLWVSRIAFWAALLFNIPMCLYNNYESGSMTSAVLPIILYSYLAIACYILGYRLDNPPSWARWVVREKWIAEWRYLANANPESIKQNRNKLLQIGGGTALLVVLSLALLHDKF